jgi:hypothetical protein
MNSSSIPPMASGRSSPSRNRKSPATSSSSSSSASPRTR